MKRYFVKDGSTRITASENGEIVRYEVRDGVVELPETVGDYYGFKLVPEAPKEPQEPEKKGKK